MSLDCCEHSRIQEIHSPVTVLAGDADDVIPVAQSESVAQPAPNLHEFVTLTGAGHNDGVWFGPLLADHVASLAEAAGA